MMGPNPKPLAERFWAKVDKSGECWTWTGTTSRGYGNIRVGSMVDGTRRKVTAHRVSFELHHGHVDDYRMVLHICDNPLCVRPSHLYQGTAADNGRDIRTRARAAGSHRHVPRDGRGRWRRRP